MLIVACVHTKMHVFILQLQLNNYHKIMLCVRLDAQEGRRPSIKLIRANVRGALPKTSVRSLQESGAAIVSLNLGHRLMRPQG